MTDFPGFAPLSDDELHRDKVSPLAQWRDIPGWEGLYQASDAGQIRSLDRTVKHPGGGPRRCPGRVLAQSTTAIKYKSVTLARGDGSRNCLVHRLVMAAFHGDSDLFVNHRNGDTADNRLANLEYVTPRQNEVHARTALGKRCNAKLSPAIAAEVRRLHLEGKYTLTEIARRLGVCNSTISNIVTGKSYAYMPGARVKKPHRGCTLPESRRLRLKRSAIRIPAASVLRLADAGTGCAEYVVATKPTEPA